MQNIKILYNKVFDSNGNIKLCGRDSCKDLIMALGNKFPTVYFGNPNTGMMHVENIKSYIASDKFELD